MTPSYKNMDYNKKIELLAPAGSMDSLVAAIKNGADAVYVGGTLYGARRNAKNFTDEELIKAFDLCHSYRVRVFVTMNTMLFDRELYPALKYAGWLYENGADSLIVQDIGFASMIKRELPDFELHASTQMAVHNSPGIKVCRDMGIKRVVLSREVCLRQLNILHDENPDMELEVFAHGALCMSFSGLCLYSSMAGERSGNRGMCAQPCRKPASIQEKRASDDYCLSPSDLHMLKHVNKLIEAGASCIKLEGRMKRPEYVALVTRAYRAAIDGEELPPALINDLHDIFNRGFTSGYYFGDKVITGARANDAPDPKLLSRVQRNYSSFIKRTPITMELYAHVGALPSLTASTGKVTATVFGTDALTASLKPQTHELFSRQLSKLNDSPFILNELKVDSDGISFISASELNALRRSVISKLIEKLAVKRKPVCIKKPEFTPIMPKSTTLDIIARVRTLDQARAALSASIDAIIFDPKELCADEISEIISLDIPIFLSIPPILLNHSDIERYRAALPKFYGAELNNIGHIAMASAAKHLIGGTTLNIANLESVQALEKAQILPTLSPELTKAQMRDMAANCNCAINVYGRTPLMHLAHCPIKEYSACRNGTVSCGAITDEAGRRFPLISTALNHGCITRMLNCVPTYILDAASEVKASCWTLSFTCETEAEVSSIVSAAVSARSGNTTPPSGDFTRGHLNRAVL